MRRPAPPHLLRMRVAALPGAEIAFGLRPARLRDGVASPRHTRPPDERLSCAAMGDRAAPPPMPRLPRRASSGHRVIRGPRRACGPIRCPLS